MREYPESADVARDGILFCLLPEGHEGLHYNGYVEWREKPGAESPDDTPAQ